MRLTDFHHLGIATSSIDEEAEFYERLGYVRKECFQDPLQGVEGLFMEGPGPRIELLMNLPGSTTLTSALTSHRKHHHMAFVCKDADITELCRQLDGILVKAPVDSAYFKRPIAFIMMRNEQLVEIIL